MVGAGQFLEKQNGTALLALHEGRGWLNGIFEGGAGGGVEDLNQIMDHDVYKNSPANSAGKFNIRVSARLLHRIYYVTYEPRHSQKVAGSKNIMQLSLIILFVFLFISLRFFGELSNVSSLGGAT